MKSGNRLSVFLTEPLYSILAILLNVALVLLGVWLHSAWDHDRQLVVVSGLLLILIGSLDLYLKRQYDKNKTRTVHKRYIDEILKAAALSILAHAQPPKDHMRVNLMFPDKSKRNLLIRYDYGFDPQDNDRHIKVMIGTGCAGQAWHQNKALVADVHQLSRGPAPPHWGLRQEEIQKLRTSLGCVFSIPISSPNDHELIAILNFDSDNSIEEIKIGDPSIQDIAYCFASALGNLLDET